MKRFTAVFSVLFFLATFAAIPAHAVKNGYRILATSIQASDSNNLSLVENSAFRNAVIIGLLLFAAIMLVLIYRKKKAGQGSAQTIDSRKLKKFLGKKKKEEEEDDDLVSFRCPSCQAPIKTDVRTCPRCHRSVK